MHLFSTPKGAPRAVLDAAREGLAAGKPLLIIAVPGPTRQGVAADLGRYITDVEAVGWHITLVTPAATGQPELIVLFFRPGPPDTAG